MTPLLIGLVLTAAVLHAVWNAMIKSGGTPELTIASYLVVGSLVCIVLAIFLPFPNLAAWPILIGSMAVHNLYYFALARAYRAGDLSQVYPYSDRQGGSVAPLITSAWWICYDSMTDAAELLPFRLSSSGHLGRGKLSPALPRNTPKTIRTGSSRFMLK